MARDTPCQRLQRVYAYVAIDIQLDRLAVCSIIPEGSKTSFDSDNLNRFTWGTEMTYCTPYLLQLGLTKSKLSLVWIAGPLSGLIMQPIVGIMADKSTSKWGRRRPVMVGGTVIVSICLLILGWTKEIIAAFVGEGELVGRSLMPDCNMRIAF
jgi:hypothetical protein